MPRYGFCCWRTKPGQYCTFTPSRRSSAVTFAPPPCHRLPWKIITEPAGISSARTSTSVGASGDSGVYAKRCDPGTKRVPPLSAVKSVSAHMLVTIIGTCGSGRWRAITMSSPCIGCGCSPGPMSIAVMPESRQPRSSRRSTIGSTFGCTGIAWNTGSLASRLYMRSVA